jgi:predicted nucleic acid-binding protein
MNLYIDTSALIKLFVLEEGSDDVASWADKADIISTSLISRAETVAGLNRLVRIKILEQEQCDLALDDFRRKWVDYHRIPITEQVVAHADSLTC